MRCKTNFTNNKVINRVVLPWHITNIPSIWRVFKPNLICNTLLCSRIQGYMLSLINKIDPCVAFVACFVWDAKPVFPTLLCVRSILGKVFEFPLWDLFSLFPMFCSNEIFQNYLAECNLQCLKNLKRASPSGNHEQITNTLTKKPI